VEDPPLAGPGEVRFTARLRLEPVGRSVAADLWLVHNDDEVWPWYDHGKPSLEQAEQWAKSMGDSWRLHGVHKWIAHDGAQAVVSCTARHNVRSRAVMERIGMRYAGEIRSHGMVEGVEGIPTPS
jgi:hypothetical protein